MKLFYQFFIDKIKIEINKNSKYLEIKMSEAEITDIDLETYDRNIILNEQQSKLPSYCYWDSYSIEKESLKERYNWWKSINNS